MTGATGLEVASPAAANDGTSGVSGVRQEVGPRRDLDPKLHGLAGLRLDEAARNTATIGFRAIEQQLR
jgi:hypothetical protein